MIARIAFFTDLSPFTLSAVIASNLLITDEMMVSLSVPMPKLLPTDLSTSHSALDDQVSRREGSRLSTRSMQNDT